ncbi:MAG: PEGA domain-containing protein [Polyangiaceae bacterium]
MQPELEDLCDEDIPTRIHQEGAALGRAAEAKSPRSPRPSDSQIRASSAAARAFDPRKTALGIGLDLQAAFKHPPLDWGSEEEASLSPLPVLPPLGNGSADPDVRTVRDFSLGPKSAPEVDEEAKTALMPQFSPPSYLVPPAIVDEGAPVLASAVQLAATVRSAAIRPTPEPQPPPYYPSPFESAPLPALTLGTSQFQQRPPRRWARSVAMVVIALAALCAALVLWQRPHRGSLHVDIAVDGKTPVRDVEVFVDGQRECIHVPCLVENVAAGARTVRIVAQGFAAPEALTEMVAAGRQSVVRVPLESMSSRTGLSVGGRYPDVKVSVDGEERGTLPLRVTELAPGPHRLRIAGSDRYEPLERTVEVAAGRVSDLGEIKLAVRLGRITVDLATPGATVLIVRDGTRKVMHGPWPMSVEVTTADAWRLSASKPGFEDFEMPLDFGDGQATKSVTIDLAKRH